MMIWDNKPTLVCQIVEHAEIEKHSAKFAPHPPPHPPKKNNNDKNK